jgi:transposase
MPILHEQQTRAVLASFALLYGVGGITAVHKASGVARGTISKGISEIFDGNILQEGDRTPKTVGGRLGRPLKTDQDVTLLPDLMKIVGPATRGDPESPNKWTNKSSRNIAMELNKMGHNVSHSLVCKLLHQLGYSLRSPKKTKEGNQHEDRDQQFQHIAELINQAIKEEQAIISIDTKNKELIGDYKKNGRVWCKEAPEALAHDFPNGTDKAVPFGVFDFIENEAVVSVGRSHDTPKFAVNAIQTWYYSAGIKHYNNAKYILILADSGGSNSYRSKAFKIHLQDLATKIGKTIKVAHYPPGTSKWNPIEHKLFCFISSNWRGKFLDSYDAVAQYIRHTRTSTGLTVKCRQDKRKYNIGEKYDKEKYASIKLDRDKFHGEWNYTIRP